MLARLDYELVYGVGRNVERIAGGDGIPDTALDGFATLLLGRGGPALDHLAAHQNYALALVKKD